MKAVERNMTQPSHAAKGQPNRRSLPTGRLRDHPAPVLPPKSGKKNCDGGKTGGQGGIGRRAHESGQHAVKMMHTGVARRTLTVLLTAVGGTSKATGSKRMGTSFTSNGSDSVQRARKLARRLKGSNAK